MYSTTAASWLEERMAQIDSKENSVVATYAQHSNAENAINLLKKGNFNIKKLAIVGKGCHTEERQLRRNCAVNNARATLI
jgi:hypothetical protein